MNEATTPDRYIEIEYSGPSGSVMKQRISLGEKGNHRIEEQASIALLVVWVDSMTYKYPIDRVLSFNMRL